MTAALRVGCSGWSYKDWRGVVYPAELPQRMWFDHYQQLFDTVVAAGLDPAIQFNATELFMEGLDGRLSGGHDELREHAPSLLHSVGPATADIFSRLFTGE